MSGNIATTRDINADGIEVTVKWIPLLVSLNTEIWWIHRIYMIFIIDQTTKRSKMKKKLEKISGENSELLDLLLNKQSRQGKKYKMFLH